MKQLPLSIHQPLRRWFWLLLLANILFIAGSKIYLSPLTAADITRFELAKHTTVAEEIIQYWIGAGLYDKGVQSIYIDFLFILLYTSGLAVACNFLSRLTKHEILFRTGRFFTYLLVAAGICDVIENIALLKSLRQQVTYWNVVVAYDMAATKFSLLILTVLFIFICLLFWGFQKIKFS